MKSASLDLFGDKFMELLPKLMHEFNSYESPYITSGEITPLQLTVLNCLSTRGDCEMCKIAQALNVSFPTATGMMDRLVKSGFVKREHGQDDRRKVFVVITPKGRRITQDIFKRKRQALLKMFSCISSQERSRYLEILEKVVNHLPPCKGESQS